MKSAEILVIGATGTIGRYLLEELHQRGAAFRALVRSTEKARLLEEKGYTVFIGDLNDPESLRRAMQGVKKVFLLSSPSENQVGLQRNALQAAIEAQVSHIVKISALGADTDSPLQLGRMHAQTELEIKCSGISWTFLHPHTFLQNLFANLQSVREQGVLYSFTNDGRYAPVDARDVAEVAARILTEDGHEGKTYILTGPEAISMKDIADTLELVLDKDIKVIAQSPQASYEAMIKAGLPDWLAKDLTLLNDFYAKNMASEVSEDVLMLTGHRPTSLKQFTADHSHLFR